ncbi:uncharacterized protein LOC135942612 [Cloeon dipterum]|uniref:uncharacterized protein LOC135942612 n=1 Tax=Cloeon dipterum TaxID=197152 RepID=UPI00321F9E50
MAVDETIHREQLCIPWGPPENFDSRLASLVHDLCDGRRSLASTKSSSSEALQEASSLLRRKDVSDTERVKRYILMKFMDSTIEFLAPENKDLQTDTHEEKQLLDLSACLSALGIETDDELDQLFNTLIQYTYCESCKQKPFDLNALCKNHKPYLEGKSILIGLKRHFLANSTDSEDADVDEASNVQSTGKRNACL